MTAPSTILFTNFPAEGHVNPMRPIVSELVQRGHEVLWYTGGQFTEKVLAAGATVVPMREGKDLRASDVDAFVAARGELKGVRGLQWDFKHLFIDHALGYRKDLGALYASRKVDLVVSELVHFATNLLAPHNTPPAVGIGVFPFGATSRDTAPFGPGMSPDGSALGRVRNRAMNLAARHLVFGSVQRHLNHHRRTLGLPSIRSRGMLDEALHSYRLYLQATIPDFEYPRSDLAKHVEFIGPLLPGASADFTPPAWWHRLDDGRPVVLVTQGTIAKDPQQLILPTLAALRDEKLTVIVTAPDWAGPSDAPSNAVIAGFVPYSELLPRVDVVVTNGGYGGVQFALSHGKPLVVAGLTEEKAEINARVAWSKVGIDLKSQSPTPQAIRGAVRRVLSERQFRENAERMSVAMSRTNAPKRAADLILAEVEACSRASASGHAAVPSARTKSASERLG